MDNYEKCRRCRHVLTRYDSVKGMVYCKVYTRWVADCDDCSFLVRF